MPGCEPVESFLMLIPILSHGAKALTDTVVDFLNENKIPLSNCRGQSYDNASNMSGDILDCKHGFFNLMSLPSMSPVLDTA